MPGLQLAEISTLPRSVVKSALDFSKILTEQSKVLQVLFGYMASSTWLKF